MLATLYLVMGVVACAGRPSAPPAPLPEPIGVAPSLPTIHFTIQVGAFSTSERAARYADRLETLGLDAYYFIDIDGLCKVRFQRFETHTEARHRALTLQSQGLIDDFFIVRPQAQGPPDDQRAALRRSIVRTAHRFIGTPYHWGGTSPQTGFDCSGLTMTVYRLNGLELERSSRAQFHSGSQVPIDELQPGDLVFFATGRSGRVSHVGIYNGRGVFVHAPGRGKRIRIAALSERYFKTRYVGARRYF